MSSSANTLQLKNILVNQPTQTPEEAIVHSGQILQQAGTAMVAQANQLPQQVLSLLR